MGFSQEFAEALKHLLEYVHLPEASRERINAAIDNETDAAKAASGKAATDKTQGGKSA